MKPMQPMSGGDRWWPDDLGEPSSSGSSNDTKYAYFERKHRLAVSDGGKVRVYDTGSKRIDGFSQSQGGGHKLTFSTGDGTIGLDALKEV